MDLVEKIEKNVDITKYKDIDTAVLAYSGGLDTSVMIKLIQDVCEADVITVTVDLGQKENWDMLEEKALSLGAKKHYTIHAVDEFVEQYISKAIKANSLYQGAYPNSTTLGRPLIAKKLVDIAKKHKANAIAHGCTGKGNDQVRMDISVHSLNPDLTIIAPVREWNLARDEEMEYAKKNGIPIPKQSKYSIDENIWGRSIECDVLENPSNDPPVDVFQWITLPEKAPNKPTYVKVWFNKGIPSKLEYGGQTIVDRVAIINQLNKAAAASGIGIIDHMEDRVIGLKSREIYEAPAATVLLQAHRDLEKLVFTREENEFKPIVDKLWSELVYKGLWFSPIMDELNAFIDKSQEAVDGWVKLKFYKGNAQVLSRYSEHALYDINLATYEKWTTFDQKHSIGFIELWGLNTVLAKKVRK